MKRNINIIGIIICSLFIVVVALSVFCFFLIRDKNKEYSNDFTVEQKRKVEVLERNFLVGIANNQIQLSNNTVLIDLQNSTHQFSQILDDKASLIVRISENDCAECIVSLLTKVIRLSSNMEYNNRVVLLASYHNRSALNVLINQLKIQFPVFLVNELPLIAEKYDQPYCFVTDRLMFVSHAFVPEKSEPDISNQYFEKLGERYFGYKKPQNH